MLFASGRGVLFNFTFSADIRVDVGRVGRVVILINKFVVADFASSGFHCVASCFVLPAMIKYVAVAVPSC